MDEWGAVSDHTGLNIPKLLEHVRLSGQGLRGFEHFRQGESTLPLFISCDVLLPCALDNVIDEYNVEAVNARMIVEGANGPVSPSADEVFYERGIPIIPDVLANSGGVIGSCREHQDNLTHKTTEESDVLNEIYRRQWEAFEIILKRNHGQNVSLRTSTYELALERIIEATYQQMSASQR